MARELQSLESPHRTREHTRAGTTTAEEEPPGKSRWNNSWYRAWGASSSDKEGHFSAQRDTVHREDLIVPNTYTSHNRDSEYMTCKYTQSFRQPHLNNGWDNTKINKDIGDLRSTTKREDRRVFIGRSTQQRSMRSFKCTWNVYQDRPHSPPSKSH